VVDEATQGAESKVGLADAVDALRAELSEAMARACDQEIQFPVEEIQIQVEFQIGVTREAGREGWPEGLGSGTRRRRQLHPRIGPEDNAVARASRDRRRSAREGSPGLVQEAVGAR
jgi:Trypsin-co-occurring domain 2